jgi:hypothetical protein
MKINIKHFTKNPSFETIGEGDAFFFEGDCYIKIYTPDYGEINAVNLRDGVGYCFRDGDTVEPANVIVCLANEVN